MFDAQFFDEELLQAVADVQADIIPLGDHRFKVTSVDAEVITLSTGGIQKLIVFRGFNADNGATMVVRFGLLKKDGSPNPNALRDLGRGLIEAGIRRPLPEIMAMGEFPVVLLTVKEEEYIQSTGESKKAIKRTIGKCDNQGYVKVGKAAPPAMMPAASHDDEGGSDVPF